MRRAVAASASRSIPRSGRSGTRSTSAPAAEKTCAYRPYVGVGTTTELPSVTKAAATAATSDWMP